jgi:hypothetical protein
MGLLDKLGISRLWNRTHEPKRDMQREMLAFAVLIGYNAAAGGMQVVDPMARHQFWRRETSELLHGAPILSRPSEHLMAVEPGKQREIVLPDKRKAQILHTMREENVDGRNTVIEMVEVRGVYPQAFIYTRRHAEDGELQFEVRLGEKFQTLSARPTEGESPYARELKRLMRALAAPAKA